MSTRSSSKKAVEEEIVRDLLRVAAIEIRPDGVCRAEPPFPDVLCTLTDGTRVAFELTEAIDPAVVRSVKSSNAARARMYDYQGKMGSSDRAKLKGILGDAHVSVHYTTDMTEARFKQLLPGVFNLLLDLTPGMKGELEYRSLPDGIQRIYVTRGMNGPLFGPRGPALYVRETTASQIEKKFSKQYECDCPIELVVHSATKPLPPEPLWCEEVHEFVEREIKRSPFRKVWVFDFVRSAIQYAYPNSA